MHKDWLKRLTIGLLVWVLGAALISVPVPKDAYYPLWVKPFMQGLLLFVVVGKALFDE